MFRAHVHKYTEMHGQQNVKISVNILKFENFWMRHTIKFGKAVAGPCFLYVDYIVHQKLFWAHQIMEDEKEQEIKHNGTNENSSLYYTQS